MAGDNDHIENAKNNYELLHDVEMLLGLACILPYLETMQRLSKFAQEQDTFTYDFIFALKLVKANLFNMYCDIEKNYSPHHFFLLVELIEHISDVVCLTWWIKHAYKVDYVAFFVGGKFYMLHVINLITRIRNIVNKEYWVQTIDFMKK
jgi:hypothetical protein